MKYCIILWGILLGVNYSVSAQDTVVAAKPKPSFYSVTQAALLEGAAGSAFALQSVNGIRYKDWAFGLGAGLDKYAVRSIPLFFQVQRRLPVAELPLWFYADAGLHFLWNKSNESGQWGTQKDHNGLYYDLGAQYQVQGRRRKNGLVFGFGYSVKKYSREETTPGWCVGGNCPDQKNTWWYTYRRLAFKAGYRF